MSSDRKGARPNALEQVNFELGEERRKCEKHGEYTSRGMRVQLAPGRAREVWSGCRACQADEEAAAAERQRIEAARRVQSRLESAVAMSALPQRFIGRTFGNYVAETDAQRNALAKVKAFSERFDSVSRSGRTLILSGGPGTGKTHLAAAALQHVLHNHGGLYVTLMGMIRMVRDTWRRDSERSESQVIADLTRVDLLVIDELGVWNGGDAERNLLFDIADRRYLDRKPMILITNLDWDAMKADLGDRLFDRLTEVAVWVPFDWPSYRMIARKEQQNGQ